MHFTAWSRARLWRGVWKLAPSRDFRNQRARGRKTIGSHLGYGVLYLQTADWCLHLGVLNITQFFRSSGQVSLFTVIISSILIYLLIILFINQNLSFFIQKRTLTIFFLFARQLEFFKLSTFTKETVFLFTSSTFDDLLWPLKDLEAGKKISKTCTIILSKVLGCVQFHNRWRPMMASKPRALVLVIYLSDK